ncbi:MAG: uncharacterized membrane protein YfbV (UPF0208 family) [Alphaproteobacteria bacterium]|jgi:uncharacterized membrane protein YfbV (UPF0208 family)
MNTIVSYLKSGQEYMRIWPMQKQLYALFPECRIIAATKFSMKVMPAIAVIVVAMQLQYLGSEVLPQAITMGIFFLSLPLQGILWLGHRSEQELPPQICSWYKDIYAKMQQQGCQLQRQSFKPTFKELAVLLRTAFKELDKAFTKSLF